MPAEKKGNYFKDKQEAVEFYKNSEENLNILYYPSSGDDLRPFIFTLPSSLDYLGLDHKAQNFEEPDLFIFSDYYPYNNSDLFDSRILFQDDKSSLVIEEYCELFPNQKNFQYTFNRTGKFLITNETILFTVETVQHFVCSNIKDTEMIFKNN